MHKSATKCNETVGKWYKNKHGASKIIDTLETYQAPMEVASPVPRNPLGLACALVVVVDVVERAKCSATIVVRARAF
jgi:hypothetical protein